MARPRRRSLGVLFVVIAAAFAGVAAYAAVGSAWIIAATAAVLTGWMAELAYRQLR